MTQIIENYQIRSMDYSTASTFPGKLLKALMQGDIKDKVLPLHPQLYITNKCDLDCSFCSCKNENDALEINLEDMKQILYNLKDLNCKALTLSGGGEPLQHSSITNVLCLIRESGLPIGLSTNGNRLNNYINLLKDVCTWCRISWSDFRKFEPEIINFAIQTTRNVDWSFSYVLTQNPNYDNLAHVIEYANRNHLTHVRVVGDITNIEHINMEEAIKALSGINLKLTIFQDRRKFTQGINPCLVSLLRPVFAPDGYIYPCCGAQYALNARLRRNDPKLRMGSHEEIEKIIRRQSYFDGSICKRCYYTNYNIVLSAALKTIQHPKFI